MDGFERRIYVESQLRPIVAGFVENDDLADSFWNRFRAIDDGTWWRVNPTNGTWERHSGDGWRPATETPKRVEGVSPLPFELPQAPDVEHAVTHAPTTVDRVAAAVRRVHTNYVGGAYSHVFAAARLGSLMVITTEGLWTPGVWSGSWYIHDGDEWRARQASLVDSDLLAHEQVEELAGSSPVIRGLSTLIDEWFEFPEEVSPPFEPPDLHGERAVDGRSSRRSKDPPRTAGHQGSDKWW